MPDLAQIAEAIQKGKGVYTNQQKRFEAYARNDPSQAFKRILSVALAGTGFFLYVFGILALQNGSLSGNTPYIVSGVLSLVAMVLTFAAAVYLKAHTTAATAVCLVYAIAYGSISLLRVLKLMDFSDYTFEGTHGPYVVLAFICFIVVIVVLSVSARAQRASNVDTMYVTDTCGDALERFHAGTLGREQVEKQCGEGEHVLLDNTDLDEQQYYLKQATNTAAL